MSHRDTGSGIEQDENVETQFQLSELTLFSLKASTHKREMWTSDLLCLFHLPLSFNSKNLSNSFVSIGPSLT